MTIGLRSRRHVLDMTAFSPYRSAMVKRLWLVPVALTALLAACGSTPKQAEMVTHTSGTNVPSAPSVDRNKCNDKGKHVVTSDTNQDQKPDVWKFYQVADIGGQKTEVLACKQVDLNHDSKVDIVYYYDDKGSATTLEEFDLDFDGKFDLTVYYAQGKKVREELDTN